MAIKSFITRAFASPSDEERIALAGSLTRLQMIFVEFAEREMIALVLTVVVTGLWGAAVYALLTFAFGADYAAFGVVAVAAVNLLLLGLFTFTPQDETERQLETIIDYLAELDERLTGMDRKL